MSSVVFQLVTFAKRQPVEGLDKSKVVCLRYFHVVSHNLKLIVSRFGITVVFKTADFWLGYINALFGRMREMRQEAQ